MVICLGGEPSLVTIEVMLLGSMCNVVNMTTETLNSVVVNSSRWCTMNCKRIFLGESVVYFAIVFDSDGWNCSRWDMW